VGRLLGPALIAVRLPLEAVDILAVDIQALLPILSHNDFNQRSQSLGLLLVLHRLAVHIWRRTYYLKLGLLHRVYKMHLSCFTPHVINV